MRLFRLLLFLCLAQTLMASKEIYVHLETDVRLHPLYLEDIITDDKNFPKAYLYQLQKVMQFDFKTNGRLFLADKKEIVGIDLHNNAISFYADLWKKNYIPFVIVPKIEKGKLICDLFMTYRNKEIRIQGGMLSGELFKDRRVIHQMADEIHQQLFAVPGICSTKILYTVRKRNPDPRSELKWLSEVYECDFDGENNRQLTQEHSYCVSPKYLPPQKGHRSKYFFYVSYLEGQPKIFIDSLDQSQKQRFISLRGNQLMPEISLDRNMVAFINDAPGNPEVFLQRFNPETGPIGKPRQIFSCSYAAQASPTISPDGNYIAFVSDKSGSPRIYVMKIPALGEKQKDIEISLISKSNRENTSPSWSPDGTKLAYSCRVEGVRQIWIYDFQTGKERQLTYGPGNKENPSWASDSLHLVFNSANRNSSELYLVNLNQPEAIRITKGVGEKRFPHFEPRVN